MEIATKKAEPNNRAKAIRIFNCKLPGLNRLAPRKFRSVCINAIVDEVKCSSDQASTLYNNAKKKAVLSGKIEDFSRSAKTAALAVAG